MSRLHRSTGRVSHRQRVLGFDSYFSLKISFSLKSYSSKLLKMNKPHVNSSRTQSTFQSTVEPRYNKPLLNEDPRIMNDIFHPNTVEPRYYEPLFNENPDITSPRYYEHISGYIGVPLYFQTADLCIST